MTVELHLWVMPVRGQSPRTPLKQVLQPFLQDNPGLEVRTWVVPWGTAWDRSMSALKGRPGGGAPDVLQIDSLWAGTLGSLGLLQELTPHLWEMEGEGGLPALWEFCRLPPTRRIFAVPWMLDLRLLHVRKDALSRAGLAVDALGSWEGIESLLARAPRRGPDSPAPWRGESLLAALFPWVWAAGGNFLSSDGRRPDFLSPEALRAAAFYRRILDEGPAAGLWPASLGSPRDAGVLPLAPPRGPAGRFALLGGSALSVTKASRHPEESLRLLRHLASRRTQRDVASAVGLLPSHPADAETLLDPAGRAALADSLPWARIPQPDVLLGSLDRLLQRHLAEGARGPAPWEVWRAALEAAAVEAERLFSFYEAVPKAPSFPKIHPQPAGRGLS